MEGEYVFQFIFFFLYLPTPLLCSPLLSTRTRLPLGPPNLIRPLASICFLTCFFLPSFRFNSFYHPFIPLLLLPPSLSYHPPSANLIRLPLRPCTLTCTTLCLSPLLLLLSPCYRLSPFILVSNFLFGQSFLLLTLFLMAAPSTIAPCSSRIYLPRIVLPLSIYSTPLCFNCYFTLLSSRSRHHTILTSFPELLDPGYTRCGSATHRDQIKLKCGTLPAISDTHGTEPRLPSNGHQTIMSRQTLAG